MADSNSRLTLVQLVTQLRQLVEAQQTGTLFITTSSKHSALLSVKDGQIISISYESYHGMDALQVLQSKTVTRYRFTPKLFASLIDDDTLPPTAYFLDMVDGWSRSNKAVVTLPQTWQATTDLPLIELGTAVSEEAIDYFGPIGSALCNKKFQALQPTDSKTLVAAVEQIAAELGNERLGKQFVSRAIRRIDSILGSS